MSFQKVVGHIGLRTQRQPGYEGPVPQFLTRESLVFQGVIEVRRGSGVLAGVCAEAAVGGVKLAGFALQAVTDLAALVQEMPQPVIVLAVLPAGPLDTFRQRNPEVMPDDILRALNDPGEDRAACVPEQVIAVVFKVVFALKTGSAYRIMDA